MNKIDMVSGLVELTVHRCSVRSVGSTELPQEGNGEKPGWKGELRPGHGRALDRRQGILHFSQDWLPGVSQKM